MGVGGGGWGWGVRVGVGGGVGVGWDGGFLSEGILRLKGILRVKNFTCRCVQGYHRVKFSKHN